MAIALTEARSRALRSALVAFAVAFGVLILVLAQRSDHATLFPEGFREVLVSWGFTAAGVIAWGRRPDNRVGAYMVLVGISWLPSALTVASSSVLATIGLLFTNVSFGVFVMLSLAYPTGRITGRAPRLIVLAAWIYSLGVWPATLLVSSSHDLGCAKRCPENLLALTSASSLARTLAQTVSAVVVIATLIAVGVVLVGRYRRASAPARRALSTVFVGFAVLFGVAFVIFTLDAFGVDLNGNDALAFDIALTGIPAAFLIGLMRERLARASSLAGLVAGLGEDASTDLRARIAGALGDPDLRIAYWFDDARAWFAADGSRSDVDASAAGVTVIERLGTPVAALLHDPALADNRELIDAVAAAAGLALENERLQFALEGRLEEQAALRRVATLVARQRPFDEIIAVVTEELGRLLRARTANMIRFDRDARGTVVGGWSAVDRRSVPTGTRVMLDSDTAVTLVLRTGEPARVDDYSDLPGEHAGYLRDEIGVRAGVAAPIRVGGQVWGAVTVSVVDDDQQFPADAEQRLGAFAELVSQAIANADASRQLTESRARIVQVGDASRRRIERDLHDGAQQRLVALALQLRLARAHAHDPEAVTAALDRCAADLAVALAELRELARGIHPAVLSDRGLRPALQAIADRAPVPVSLEVELARDLPATHDAALYFVASEALANVAKYAHATSVSIRVWSVHDSASIEVADDGIGGADPSVGSGLSGLVDRVEALGGALVVSSPRGGGTTVVATVPMP